MEKLPDEILGKIVLEMDWETLKQFCLVSRRFSSFLNLPGIAEKVFSGMQKDFNQEVGVENLNLNSDLEGLQFPLDEEKAFKLKIHKNGWRESCRCYQKSFSDLRNVPNPSFSEIISTHVLNRGDRFALLVFLSCFLVFNIVVIAVSTSFYCLTLFSTAFTLLIFFTMYELCNTLSIPKKKLYGDGVDLVVSFYGIFFYPVLLVGECGKLGFFFIAFVSFFVNHYCAIYHYYSGERPLHFGDQVPLSLLHIVIAVILRILEDYFALTMDNSSLTYRIACWFLKIVAFLVCLVIVNYFCLSLSDTPIKGDRQQIIFILSTVVLPPIANGVLARVFPAATLANVMVSKAVVLCALTVFPLLFYVRLRRYHRERLKVLAYAGLNRRLVSDYVGLHSFRGTLRESYESEISNYLEKGLNLEMFHFYTKLIRRKEN